MVGLCCVCGSKGFSVALIDCHRCEGLSIHKYCLETIPKNINDYVVWICDECERESANPGSSSDVEEKSTQINSLMKEKGGKFIEIRNNSAGEMDHQRREGVEVKNSGKFRQSRSENHRKDQAFKKQKLAHGDGEKSCIEEANVRNCSNADSAKDVKKGISKGENQSSVLANGGHCEGDSGLLKDMNADREQSKIHRKSEESGQCKRLALEGGCNLSSKAELEDIEVADRAENGSVNMLQYAQPIVYPVWKGQFHISNEKYGAIGGLAAYLSSLACQKVHSEAKLLSENLSFELLPRSEIWPKGFQRSRPTDNNIALYFLPDNERDEIYESLINDIIDNDFAMRAIVENAELLVFTSTILPIKCWRYGTKFYLWGVFKTKTGITIQGRMESLQENIKASRQ